MMFLKKSKAKSSSPPKQAVIDRYNELHELHDGEQVDWGALVAELIDAYHRELMEE